MPARQLGKNHPDWNEGGTYRSLPAADQEYDADHNFKLNSWSYAYPRFTKPFYYGQVGQGMVYMLMFDRMYSEQDELRFSIFKFTVKPTNRRPAWDFQKYLEAHYRVECTTSFYAGTGSPSKLENLDSLKSADLLVLFARRMALREEQMKLIRAHWEQGKPIVGIRTACHAFQKADNAIIDRKLFGGDYGVGPSSNGGFKTAIAKGQENHPVLKGVGEIKAAKYAYGNGPLADSAVVLQIVGRIKDRDFPATWVNTCKGGRYFYTSLGSPDDFQEEGMKRLLANAVFWTAQREPEKMKK